MKTRRAIAATMVKQASGIPRWREPLVRKLAALRRIRAVATGPPESKLQMPRHATERALEGQRPFTLDGIDSPLDLDTTARGS